MTGLRDLKVGDRVQVFDMNGLRSGQPEGGWDGTITKMGRKLVTVEYGNGRHAVFRLDTGRINDNYGHYHVTTPEQAADRVRRRALMGRLREAGVEIRYGHSFSTETLEALAAVLDQQKEQS